MAVRIKAFMKATNLEQLMSKATVMICRGRSVFLLHLTHVSKKSSATS